MGEMGSGEWGMGSGGMGNQGWSNRQIAAIHPTPPPYSPLPPPLPTQSNARINNLIGEVSDRIPGVDKNRTEKDNSN